MTIAALYVEDGGVYYDVPDVDPWPLARDARRAGLHAVVAHPPCERWGRYWSGGPSAAQRRLLGKDDGTFSHALWAVRSFGGVLEHPEASHAWRWYGIDAPRKSGGWVRGDRYGYTCCVEQGHYGHLARKATWLYVAVPMSAPRSHAVRLPELIWGPAKQSLRLDEGFHSAEERRRAIRTGVCQRLSARQRAATPPAFRDLLLEIARSVHAHD
jgi:hypothetical protein